MRWYGLKVDGQLEVVTRWRLRTPPTVFDFYWPLSSEFDYEVVEVVIEEAR